MKNWFVTLIIILNGSLLAQTPPGDEILKRVDQNITAENKVLTSQMIIYGRRGERTVHSKSWIQGTEKSFTEYLDPPRESGTKMLKLGDQLWMYSPQTDRTIRIAGHMLRQSVMGSDLSYEDLMEDPQLHKIYSVESVQGDVFNSQPCWVLELQAKQSDVAYQRRKIWVDQARYLVLKEERFAKTGRLLKTTVVKSVMQVNNRWVPEHIVFRDVLKNGNGTEFIIDSITFNVAIPEHIFSKAALRK